MKLLIIRDIQRIVCFYSFSTKEVVVVNYNYTGWKPGDRFLGNKKSFSELLKSINEWHWQEVHILED